MRMGKKRKKKMKRGRRKMGEEKEEGQVDELFFILFYKFSPI